MVARAETLSQTSLTDSVAKLALKGNGFTPPSPDRYVVPEEIPYSVAELEKMTEGDLEELGLGVLDVLEASEKGLESIYILEKENSLETVMRWASGYWANLNSALETKLARTPNEEAVYLADIKIRALGVKKFLDKISEYTDEETYETAAAILTTASDLFIRAEVDAGNLSVEKRMVAGAISRAVDTAFENPAFVDVAAELAFLNTKDARLREYLTGALAGVKSEYLSAQIIHAYEYPDIGYEITLSRPHIDRDILEGTDFILQIREGRNVKELCLFDIRTSLSSSGYGTCRIEPPGGRANTYEGDYPAPHLYDYYVIEDSFDSGVQKRNTTGIVVRLPRTLLTHTFEDLSKMDSGGTPAYNEAKSGVLRAISIITERIGK